MESRQMQITHRQLIVDTLQLEERLSEGLEWHDKKCFEIVLELFAKNWLYSPCHIFYGYFLQYADN
jgi:regulator of sirC expression with transglutaminase-like and TPR domain